MDEPISQRLHLLVSVRHVSLFAHGQEPRKGRVTVCLDQLSVRLWVFVLKSQHSIDTRGGLHILGHSIEGDLIPLSLQRHKLGVSLLVKLSRSVAPRKVERKLVTNDCPRRLGAASQEATHCVER